MCMLDEGASADNVLSRSHGIFGCAVLSLELHGGSAWAPWFA